MKINPLEWIKLYQPLPVRLGSLNGEMIELSGRGMLLTGVSKVSLNSLRKSPFLLLVQRLQESFSFEIDPSQIIDDETKGLIILFSQPQKQLADKLLGQIRKNQHIDLCHHVDVESTDKNNGLGNVELSPCAAPEINWEELDTSQNFLGKQFSMPVLITGMTGGVEKGTKINQFLAREAAEWGIPMGVGSQRIALESPEYADIFQVKREVPEVFLIGNIGASQLLSESDPVSYCQRAVEMIDADAMAIHLNVLQECIQPEGDRLFKGVVDRVHEVSSKLHVPIVIKEVGAGMDVSSAKLLVSAGARGIDVGGKGGTSWGYIEGLRSSDPETQRTAELFRDWGLATGTSLKALAASGLTRKAELIATGGIRDGLDVAKVCALGAKMAGIGLPLLRAALVSQEEVHRELSFINRSLRIAMLITGSRTVADLKFALTSSH